MDGLAIMQVSGAVTALMYLLRWAGVPPRWAPLLVLVLSTLGVGVWAYGQAPIGQADTFSYVAGWIGVATSAATVWGFTWAAGKGLGVSQFDHSSPAQCAPGRPGGSATGLQQAAGGVAQYSRPR